MRGESAGPEVAMPYLSRGDVLAVRAGVLDGIEFIGERARDYRISYRVLNMLSS